MTGIKTPGPTRTTGERNPPLISDKELCDLYSRLIVCRLLDQSILRGAIRKNWAGSEAVTSAATACLRTGDSVPSTPRSFAATYLLSQSLMRANATLPGATAQLAAATGDALRHKLEAQGGIAVAFAEAGAVDSMRVIFSAAARQFLPVLYVLNDDSRIEEASGGIPTFRMDSADTVAAYRVVRESIARARDGGGPAIMLCAVWPGEESPDAIARLEQLLIARRLLRPGWKRQLERKHRTALARAARNAGTNS